MMGISKLDRLWMKDLLKKLNLLSSLKKSLWKRWILQYQRINDDVNFYKIEYYNSWEMSLSYAKEKSIELFNKLFGIDLKVEEIQFISNQDLKWWLRVFCNDDMYDLSYKRFEKLLK